MTDPDEGADIAAQSVTHQMLEMIKRISAQLSEALAELARIRATLQPASDPGAHGTRPGPWFGPTSPLPAPMLPGYIAPTPWTPHPQSPIRTYELPTAICRWEDTAMVDVAKSQRDMRAGACL